MENFDLPAQIMIFMFFGIFLTTSGVFMGATVRRLMDGNSAEMGQMVLGGMFGGVAVLMSAVMLKPANPGLFYADFLFFLIPFLLVAFMSEFFTQRIGSGTLISIGLGLFITVLGGFIGWAGSNNGGGTGAWLFGGCWSVFGILFLQMGVMALVRGKPLRLRPSRDGSYTIVPDDAPRKSRKRTRASDDQNPSDEI
jgi:hypothetical protein